MAKTVPNFGQIVMAARNGWKWAQEWRLFIRITSTPGCHKVELQPPTFKPEIVPGGFTDRADWQMQEGVLNMLPALPLYQLVGLLI